LRRRLGALPALAALAVSACAYDPPMRANHAAPAYRADLKQCQTDGEAEASRRVHALFRLFVFYPITYPVEIRIATRECMQHKGYTLRD